MLRRALPVVVAGAALVGAAHAHSPSTAIGRAVLAFGSVSVSYEPGSAVSEVEAGGFPLIVDSNPKVAFMPASASTEMVGGPDAIAAEIAREAELDGTLVVLVGEELGTWSDGISDERLAELVAGARTGEAGSSPAGRVESLVRSVQAEPVDSGPPRGWIGAGLLVLALGALVAFDRWGRRASGATRRP